MNQSTNIIAATVLALGLVASSFTVGQSLISMKRSERSVTVRGLAERDVQADLALWSLQFKTTGDDLTVSTQQLKQQEQAVVQFLTGQGFEQGDIQLLPTRLVDRQAREYGNNQYNQPRYILESGVNIRTDKVQLVDQVSRKTNGLVARGVALAGDNSCDNVPSFMFTKLGEVKPDMLADAMKDARAAAGQFARDADAAVGSIRRATQGYFSISARDSIDGQYSGNNCGDRASVDKRLRVVTTIDYYLE